MGALITKADIQRNRANFDTMERRILAAPQLTADDFQLQERVSGGLYYREITIPKDGVLTGRIYRFDHIEIMVRGDITILAANGGERRYIGYNVFEAQAGKRQAGYAHEETVWVTINRVPDIGISKMLDWTTCLTYEDFHGFHEALDREDYKLFLGQTGMTQEQMDKIVMQDDLSAMDLPHLYLADSKRHGKGLFCDITISKGHAICPARDGSLRTIAGRFTNHGCHANAVPAILDGVPWFIAVRDIPAGDEITVNYRDVVNLRQEAGV